MNKFKVCMLGAFAVGKTSLVRRFVDGIFDERYHTTLGVKIDRKTLSIDDKALDFVLWDLAGEDEFIKLRGSYLRGSAAGVLVADGTRGETLELAIDLRRRLYAEVGEVPVVLMVNKSDLGESWEIAPQRLDSLRGDGWQVFESSARDDSNVDLAFRTLAGQLLAQAS